MESKRFLFLVLFFGLLLSGTLFSVGYAQEETTETEAIVETETQNAIIQDDSQNQANQSSPAMDAVRRKAIPPKSYPSLFFTYWQHQAIGQVKKSGGAVRPPTEAELNTQDEYVPDRGVREITLGGIVYKGEGDWVIWLNNERVKPDAIPKQVLDLKVFKDYIEVKWLDEFSNTIYPIKLKPHERFNLDNRIFLTGE